jgi:hypothetical protein
VYALFRELKSIAVYALKEGKSEDEVMKMLLRRLSSEKRNKQPPAVKPKDASSVKELPKVPVLFRVLEPGHPQNTLARSEERQRGHRWALRCRKRRVQGRE